MRNRFDYGIMPEMQARYAVKNFSPAPVTRQELLPIFEAARYAPSCFNEQPWRFLMGDDADTHAKLSAHCFPATRGRPRRRF